MNDIKNKKNIMQIINNAKIDAQYVSDNKYPIRGICMTIGQWLFSYSLASLSLYMLSRYTLSNPQETLFHYLRIANICLFAATIVTYFIAFKRVIMTVKEKDFLRGFSGFIIVFAFLRMLTPITYYLNVEILLQIYNSIPFDMIISLLAFISIYNYSHQKNLIGIAVLNILYLIFYLFTTSIFLNASNPSIFLVTLQEWNTLLRNEGVMIILLFFITLITFYYKFQKGEDDYD